MIETVITIKLKTDRETFEQKDFQEVLNQIKSGKMRREFESGGRKDKWTIKADCTYWTNYKQAIKENKDEK
jgi:hypothetical protein